MLHDNFLRNIKTELTLMASSLNTRTHSRALS